MLSEPACLVVKNNSYISEEEDYYGNYAGGKCWKEPPPGRLAGNEAFILNLFLNKLGQFLVEFIALVIE